MDPISVLSIAGLAGATAKAAWNVGVGLQAFFSGVRAVDRTIDGLVAEVKALSNACTIVDQRLHDIVRDHEAELKMPRDVQGKLWACIEAQVADSQRSVEQLEDAFREVQQQRTTTLSQAKRHIVLKIQARDIDEARNRIRSHTTSLQTILQTVAIEICYLAPQRADQQLRTLLKAVDECMVQLRALREERNSPNQETNANEIEILKVCEDAVSSGESLYAASVAGGPQQQFSSPLLINIQQWMADLTAIEETVSRAPTNDLESTSAMTITGTPSAGMEKGSQRTESLASTSAIENNRSLLTSPMADEVDVDSDDEFQVELAQEALNAARSSFNNDKYQEADSFLQEALKMVRELPANCQSICDTWDIRYMLSVCAYHSQRPAEAEAKLLSVMDNTSQANNASKEQRRQVCEAGHLLSQLYIKLGNLDHARFYCSNALQGRRRLLSKSHPDTYQSYALMARICQLEANETRATIHLRMIDNNGSRSELQDKFSKLDVDSGISEAYKSAKMEDQPKSTTAASQQREPEASALGTRAEPDSLESQETRPLPELSISDVYESRPTDSLSMISTNTREMSTFSTSSVLSDYAHTEDTHVSSHSGVSSAQAACCIVFCTRFGDFTVAITTNVKKNSRTFSTAGWEIFKDEVSSGTHRDLTICRQEKIRRGRFESYIGNTSTKDLKISINTSTKHFVLEQKKTLTLLVEGRLSAGQDVINRIMMYKTGIRKGGIVEVLNLDIREAP